MHAIHQRFEQLKRDGRMALMPFLMAGDPDLTTTREVLLALKVVALTWWSWAFPTATPLQMVL